MDTVSPGGAVPRAQSPHGVLRGPGELVRARASPGLLHNGSCPGPSALLLLSIRGAAAGSAEPALGFPRQIPFLPVTDRYSPRVSPRASAGAVAGSRCPGVPLGAGVPSPGAVTLPAATPGAKKGMERKAVGCFSLLYYRFLPLAGSGHGKAARHHCPVVPPGSQAVGPPPCAPGWDPSSPGEHPVCSSAVSPHLVELTSLQTPRLEKSGAFYLKSPPPRATVQAQAVRHQHRGATMVQARENPARGDWDVPAPRSPNPGALPLLPPFWKANPKNLRLQFGDLGITPPQLLGLLADMQGSEPRESQHRGRQHWGGP